MAVREMSLESIAHIDGGIVNEAFQRHLQRAILDCQDRPGDKKPRVVLLAVNVSPIMPQDGHASECEMEFHASSKVPAHVSRPVSCQMRNGGKAVFNDLSQDNVNQKTIDELAPDVEIGDLEDE